MSDFLHKLAEGLRSREKLLEDHGQSTAFDSNEGDKFRAEYESLMQEIRSFREKVERATAAKADFDEHFEREIQEGHQKLVVKIDSWKKSLSN